MKYDVLIIGAGMSGLAAGIRLAHYDKKVCILEQHSLVGGLNSYYKMKGKEFDVGLHAITNFVKKGENKRAPLSKLLRQLRLSFDDFDLTEQNHSLIKFPNKTLKFTNNIEFLIEEISNNFPNEVDNFLKLFEYIKTYNEVALDATFSSAKDKINEFIKNPLLTEMIFLPLLYYGSANEMDMDFNQFVIMFKSIYIEGFSRPYDGVRKILNKLTGKYKNLGGELRINSKVSKINTDNSKFKSVTLANGEEIFADKILSSAGYFETAMLCEDMKTEVKKDKFGQLSYVEKIYLLDRKPKEFNYDTTIIFYNENEIANYKKANSLVDFSSGVICCPNNFAYDKDLEDGIIRITNLANFDMWNSLNSEDYKKAKANLSVDILKKATDYTFNFKDNIILEDMFTPKTVYRYTSHLNGAVYGTPYKVRDGKTKVENLYIMGTDQGFLGIIGAMLSGISLVNLHVFQN